MGKKIQLMLIPQPGSKPEFLATLVNANNADDDFWNRRIAADKIVLEGYTREPWATQSSSSSSLWKEIAVQSVDGRNKLPGFFRYLKGRQKCAYGRFRDHTAVCVVMANNTTIRICLDPSKLSNCSLTFKKQQQQQQQSSNKPAAKKGKSGVLGNLLGAQKRTNQHVIQSAKKPKQSSTKQPQETNQAIMAVEEEETKTAPQVLAEFRQKMEQEMLDFDISPEVVYRTKISLPEVTAGLKNDEDKLKITMDVLKYIVFEQAEEVNEEWVAHKEPSEFMDETVILVYKEGHAPEEVLEEMNRVELPDDMRGQQKAIQDARQRKAANQEAKIDKERFHQAMQQQQTNDYGDDDTEALNAQKRDRRSIEEIQRDTKRIKS